MDRARLHFVTDPICAWCWGMLPELEALRARLGARLDFRLCCAGLQVGRSGQLSPKNKDYLLALWQRVSETTGQTFSNQLPKEETFIYHSEIPCRLLTLARRHLGAEPWDLFHDLQAAFYLKAQDITSARALAEVAAPYGMGADEVSAGLQDQEIIDATRAEFDWCRQKMAHKSLPTLLLDTGQGPALLCGGYATADYLQGSIEARLGS